MKLQSSTIIISLLALLVGILVIAFFQFAQVTPFLSRDGVPNVSEDVSGNDREDQDRLVLYRDSTFQQAESLLLSGENEAAAELYKELLDTTTTTYGVGRLRYRLALAQTNIDPESAIRNLHLVVADPQVNNLQRSYAAQRLGLMFYRNSDDRLLALIFSEPPFKSFYAEGDKFLALRRLFEFASTISHPLALSELRAANLYLKELEEVRGTPKYDELVNQYIPIVQQKLNNADVDIERTRTTDAESLIPEALFLRATVYSRLQRLGYNYDYDAAFKEAITAGMVKGGQTDGQARVGYAMAMHQSGADRMADIKVVLAPVINDIDLYTGWKRAFTNERANVLDLKAILVGIANGYPEFKDLLLSLGWQEADFNE
jgi:hypothetical protein